MKWRFTGNLSEKVHEYVTAIRRDVRYSGREVELRWESVGWNARTGTSRGHVQLRGKE